MKKVMMHRIDNTKVSDDANLKQAYAVRSNGYTVAVGIYHVEGTDDQLPYWAVMPVWVHQEVPYYGDLPYTEVIGTLRYVQRALERALYKRHGILHDIVYLWP